MKGGGAVVSDRYRSFDLASGLEVDRANETRWGGTVGAGVEFGFAPNWTVGFEYDHISSATAPSASPDPAISPRSASPLAPIASARMSISASSA